MTDPFPERTVSVNSYDRPLSSTIALARYYNRDGLPDVAPNLDFRFSNFYLGQEDFQIWAGGFWPWYNNVSDDAAINWTVKDCSLHGGQVFIGDPTVLNPDSGESQPH